MLPLRLWFTHHFLPNRLLPSTFTCNHRISNTCPNTSTLTTSQGPQQPFLVRYRFMCTSSKVMLNVMVPVGSPLHCWDQAFCFNKISIPIANKNEETCFNDYHPVALTSTIIKCFEELVVTHICVRLPGKLNPLQFAYSENSLMEDAIFLALRSTMNHLYNEIIYIRMLFID